MTFFKSTLGLLLLSIVLMLTNHRAVADVYALSAIDVQNLSVTIIGDTGTGVSSFQFTGTNTATLNGTSDTNAGLSENCSGSIASNSCGPAGARLNALAANAPAGSNTRIDESFNSFGPGGIFSNSDSAIQNALLTGDPSTRTRQIAESNVNVSGNANSNAEITSSTGFAIELSLANTGSIEIDFEANPQLRAMIDQAFFLFGNAQANISMSVTLTDNTNGAQASWSPQGTSNNDCSVDGGFGGGAVTCTENADAEDLNRNLSTASQSTDFNYSNNGDVFSLYGIAFSNLAARNYTLAFNILTSTSVSLETLPQQNIPEPGVLVLFSLGLLGVAFTGKKVKV